MYGIIDSASIPVIAHNPISTQMIAGGLIPLLGVGMLIGQIFEKPQSTPTLAVEIVPVKSN